MNPIMLATDGSPEAEKATSNAIELAKELRSELVVLTVWDLQAIGYGPMGFGPAPVAGEHAWLGEEEAQKIAAEAAARAEEAGVETHVRVVRGFPVEAICEAARVAAPRFLVLGSHGWGAVKRALFGSVSTGVLHEAPCPVLIVPAKVLDPAATAAALEGAPA
jgi:nucleotide-binding universal stress UspA family protein